MTRTALVTGAHGFIGRHTARLLAASGYTVTGIGHGEWDRVEAEAFGLTFWHTDDVTLESLATHAREPMLIVHCAGSGSVPFSLERPNDDFARTVPGTAAVLEYVRLHSPRTSVVYPSSAAVYGAVTKIPIEETDPLSPASPYGIHKIMAEDLCRSYATHYGVSVAIVRFFSIYGTGLRKQLLWDACCKITADDLRFYGTGKEIRDWLNVDDAAALLIAAAARASSACPIVNGGSGRGTEVASMLRCIFAKMRPASQPSFDGVHRHGDPSRFVADNRRATGLGWAPTVSLDDGVDRYVRWFEASR